MFEGSRPRCGVRWRIQRLTQQREECPRPSPPLLRRRRSRIARLPTVDTTARATQLPKIQHEAEQAQLHTAQAIVDLPAQQGQSRGGMPSIGGIWGGLQGGLLRKSRFDPRVAVFATASGSSVGSMPRVDHRTLSATLSSLLPPPIAINFSIAALRWRLPARN